MIPDYKFYHGAALGELIDISPVDIIVGELREQGRLGSYILDNRIGMHVKHSTARLTPWQFTLTLSNMADCAELRRRFQTVFVVFVCGSDGIVALDLFEVVSLINGASGDQAWLRIERRRGKWYSVYGVAGNEPIKKPRGLSSVIDALSAQCPDHEIAS